MGKSFQKISKTVFCEKKSEDSFRDFWKTVFCEKISAKSFRKIEFFMIFEKPLPDLFINDFV